MYYDCLTTITMYNNFTSIDNMICDAKYAVCGPIYDILRGINLEHNREMLNHFMKCIKIHLTTLDNLEGSNTPEKRKRILDLQSILIPIEKVLKMEFIIEMNNYELDIHKYSANRYRKENEELKKENEELRKKVESANENISSIKKEIDLLKQKKINVSELVLEEAYPYVAVAKFWNQCDNIMKEANGNDRLTQVGELYERTFKQKSELMETETCLQKKKQLEYFHQFFPKNDEIEKNNLKSPQEFEQLQQGKQEDWSQYQTINQTTQNLKAYFGSESSMFNIRENNPYKDRHEHIMFKRLI